jgi:hypothetical protein
MAVKNQELLPLFVELQALLAPYGEHFAVKEPEPGRYELWSTVNTAPTGKPEHTPYFAGLIVQKSYVGLYYMPVYTNPEIVSQLGPELMARLKAKSCFHIESLTPVLRDQIGEALQLGLDLYKRAGWV